MSPGSLGNINDDNQKRQNTAIQKLPSNFLTDNYEVSNHSFSATVGTRKKRQMA
jgi:hypothetical protein